MGSTEVAYPRDRNLNFSRRSYNIILRDWDKNDLNLCRPKEKCLIPYHCSCITWAQEVFRSCCPLLTLTNPQKANTNIYDYKGIWNHFFTRIAKIMNLTLNKGWRVTCCNQMEAAFPYGNKCSSCRISKPVWWHSSKSETTSYACSELLFSVRLKVSERACMTI